MVDLKNPGRSAARPSISRTTVLFIACLSALVSACTKPVEKTEDIRPVRAITLTSDSVETAAEFSGDVRPRVESRLGFRVGGKITSRKVDVGAVVKRGQVLMQLDPQDLQLAQVQANAALRAAESNRDMALAERGRYKDLREKNFVSQAILDSKETAYRAAQASYEQAAAAYRNQLNQTGYTTLASDVDGVVTGVDAEVGQVVAAGSPVVRVAQTGEKEIVIGVPEDKADTLRGVTDVRVRTWANPGEVIAGKLREMSPVADPATRTYTAKISIPNAADVKLGMTAYVTFVIKSPGAMIKVPLTALHQEKGVTSVWVIQNGAVKLVPIEVIGPTGNNMLISGGVSSGQSVVTAGVNLLKPGQKVKLLEEPRPADPPHASAKPSASSSASAGDEK